VEHSFQILDRPASLRYNILKICRAEVDVGSAAYQRNILLHVKRELHAWRVRLRSRRAAVTLLLLLTFGLGEPILCIIHCQIWVPIALQNYLAAQHAHMHHHHHIQGVAAPADQSNVPAAGAAAIASTRSANVSTCAFQSGSDSSPIHIPPSPVHDAIPAVLLLLLVSFAVGARPGPLPANPPHVFYPPPLRPPISFVV
jgi:hypothetical protein